MFERWRDAEATPCFGWKVSVEAPRKWWYESNTYTYLLSDDNVSLERNLVAKVASKLRKKNFLVS